MKIMITGGGTAGHVTPLLAIASEIRKQHPKARIRYIGQLGDPMAKMIKEQAIIEKRYVIFAGKWRRYHGLSVLGHLTDIKTDLKNMRDVILLLMGFCQSLFDLLCWQPDVVFVKGGYVGLPAGLAAAVLHIPIVTHDSDSVPGLTNRILARFAKLMAVGLPTEFYSQYYPLSKTRFTGVPIRPQFQHPGADRQIEARQQLAIQAGQKVVTIIGGSLGAVRLNELIMKNLPALLKNPDIYLLWVAGSRHHAALLEWLSSIKTGYNRLQLFTFTTDLDKLIAAADVVVSRAGATSIAELAAMAKPTILIPSPYLAHDHQSKNAESLSGAKAAITLNEAELRSQPLLLNNEIVHLLDDYQLQRQLSRQIHSLAVNDATVRIVAVIEEAAKL